MPPSGTSAISIPEGRSQGAASTAPERTVCVREARGVPKKGRHATSAAERVRRPWHLKNGNAADDRCFATCKELTVRFALAPLARSGSWTG